MEEATTSAPAESGTQATETTEATTVNQEGQTVSETTYVDGKYKSVSDLETGYKELQSSYSKKLGGFDGAPEEYKVNEGVESNDFIESWGRENQLSNDGLNSLIEGYDKYQQEQGEKYQQEQVAILGENATERLTNVNDFLKANVGENHGIDTQSAAGIESIERLIAMTKQSAPAAQAAQAPIVDADKVKAMRFAKDEFGNRRMSSDPAYRTKVEALEAELYGRK